MSNIVLFIDGENFLHKVEDVLRKEKVNIKKGDLSKIDLNYLLNKALEKYKITRKIFYAAKLHFHPKTKDKSIELILFQRYLKTNLQKQGFEFLIAGNVRGQEVTVDHKTKVLFREKGVDVKIAVDLVAMAADKKIKTAILCSSDSDLQPAVQEARKRGIEVIYLGFGFQPNKGLMYTTNETVLFRDLEILKACGVK
ncbi:hypothetical protein COY13_03840 [Candidatus Roizmanbacteria bacterium CG_4_10_14_0_2_um_filter_36_35]|uniref:NYN domain-containing protein n=5 Tax=Candidatus Roizmaniibacteriota TaxID=1752723 RepID=A0A2M7BX95_9BACT|nr:MAG: hypothetical protein COV86_03715 [Candidatus Roizmanbacteria bacterium CG11_big_fil_rev_8_21_14_0_20_35_14]PIV11150.1 MAG: hypothetical protein COS50_01770 [Candidatus Roizmanbacteria bacterium CG03_land_8_20_14_0_80_35_26]PIZ67148.1 MAG: hypothetical protein COY13_03840 [Candidatus Roizmanbacteria bacterium CG_4_10_14_0_2_um_filter_36_35]PJC33143.1 MAG: hypothetical protein CO049_01090 [Candidatus Roizmanbacteria bacterium CG_4_9_14_0_2_um_filter_36_12]PJC82076.1 MAG: hypothetical prot